MSMLHLMILVLIEAYKGVDMWLCNTVKNGVSVQCHIRYHAEKEFIVADSTEYSVISDLTEE